MFTKFYDGLAMLYLRNICNVISVNNAERKLSLKIKGDLPLLVVGVDLCVWQPTQAHG